MAINTAIIKGFTLLKRLFTRFWMDKVWALLFDKKAWYKEFWFVQWGKFQGSYPAF